jgi:potassium channel
VNGLAVIPTFHILYSQDNEENLSLTMNIRILQWFRILKIFQIRFKFNRVLFIQNYLSTIRIQNSNKQLLNIAIVGIFAIHIVACLFLFLAFMKDFSEETWISNIEPENDTVFERYVVAIYWTVQSISTIGLGDLSMKNIYEVI